MKTKDLITVWGAPEPPRLAPKQFSIRLPMLVLAKIYALCEMYPKKTRTEIIGDLLTSALEQLENDFPIVEGHQVDTDHTTGEPIYEGAGIRYSFRSLTHKHLRELEEEAGVTEPMSYDPHYYC